MAEHTTGGQESDRNGFIADLEVLEKTARNLSSARAQLSALIAADAELPPLAADSVGHGGLADAVSEFADEWACALADLETDCRTLASKVDVTRMAYANVDQEVRASIAAPEEVVVLAPVSATASDRPAHDR